MLWHEFEDGCTCDVALRALEHCLNVAHDRLKILALVQEHSIPVCHLVLPVLLPLAKGVLLEELVRCNDEHGRSGLKTHTSFYTYDCIAHMHIAANTVGSTNLLYLLYRLDGVAERLAIDSLEFAILECKAQFLLTLFLNLLEVGTIGQALCRVENLSTTD